MIKQGSRTPSFYIPRDIERILQLTFIFSIILRSKKRYSKIMLNVEFFGTHKKNKKHFYLCIRADVFCKNH